MIEKSVTLEDVMVLAVQLSAQDKVRLLHQVAGLVSEEIAPIEERPKNRRQAGSAKGQIIIADDFDAPLEDFREYM